MSEGGRESGTKPAVVYFPAGTYRVSDTIDIHSTTQVIGDASYPQVVATSDFAGDAIFNTGANFFGLVRKLQVDMKAVPNEKVISGIIWRGGKGSGVYDVVWYGNQYGNPEGKQRGVSECDPSDKSQAYTN
jgi:glucan 1,3-beta-glucosidase